MPIQTPIPAKIPEGWGEITRTDIIEAGDLFEEHSYWRSCRTSIGGSAKDIFLTSTRVIRKGYGPNPPPKEKEWLNPWD